MVDSTNLTGWMAPYETVKTMRAAVLVLGPLVARARQASVSLPGGCAIGARPIDQHLKGLEAMGVKITLNQGYVEAKAKRLHGADITLDLPTVTGTENLMMAATLAKGTTRIINAAQEPEVTDLARFLTAMGAQIEGIGTDVLTIHGVKALTPASYTIMSDRIEAGTYLAAAAITRGQVTITNAPVPEMAAVLEKFHEAGVRLSTADDRIMVEPGGSLTGVDVKTRAYPGFPTDMQAQYMALMTLAKGASVITETIFENRFMHVSELERLGADITVSGNHAIVRERRHLHGAPVMATDLRASASLVIAGLAATRHHRSPPGLPPGPGLRPPGGETLGPGGADPADAGVRRFLGEGAKGESPFPLPQTPTPNPLHFYVGAHLTDVALSGRTRRSAPTGEFEGRRETHLRKSPRPPLFLSPSIPGSFQWRKSPGGMRSPGGSWIWP